MIGHTVFSKSIHSVSIAEIYCML